MPGEDHRRHSQPALGPLRDSAELATLLQRIDGASWGRYKQLIGRYRVGEFEFAIDRVPPDPFAGSARIRLSVPRAVCRLPDELVSSRSRRLGVEDDLRFARLHPEAIGVAVFGVVAKNIGLRIVLAVRPLPECRRSPHAPPFDRLGKTLEDGLGGAWEQGGWLYVKPHRLYFPVTTKNR